MPSLLQNLPQGWEILPFSKCVNKISIKHKVKTKDYLKNGKYPIIDQAKDFISGYSNDENLLINIKKPVIVFGDHTRCFKFIDFNFIAGADGIKILSPIDEFNEKLFYYFCLALKFEDKGYSRHYQFLEKTNINIPPLEVQKAIVEKLENSFAHIDEAVHHLKAVQTNIPRLKSSLLHCAFSGKLTESQNSSHKVQTLKSVVGVEGETLPFEPPHPLIKTEIPQGWEIKTLGEIGKVISGGTPSTSNKDNFDGEIAWITPADLSGYKEKYISKGKRNLSEQGLKNSSARLLPPNSILFSSRAPIGYVAIASNALCTNQGFKNLIPNGNVSSEYIYYFLLHSKRLAESVASGTTFKEISAASFSKLPIPLPPLATQNQIVQILESKFTHLDNLAQFVNESLENLQRLKSSLLNQAFKGELV